MIELDRVSGKEPFFVRLDQPDPGLRPDPDLFEGTDRREVFGLGEGVYGFSFGT